MHSRGQEAKLVQQKGNASMGSMASKGSGKDEYY